MLLPRFSTRAVLLVTAVCAGYFLMVGLGIRGTLWAAGVAIALTSLMAIALAHAGLFALSYVVGQAFRQRSPALVRSRLTAVADPVQPTPSGVAHDSRMLTQDRIRAESDDIAGEGQP